MSSKQPYYSSVEKIKKSHAGLSIIILLITALFSGMIHFGEGRESKEIKGVISSDTVWTKANSPYSVIGNILVSQGVKLTIEAGVTVIYTGDYNIQVNGTLIAKSSDSDPIVFNGEVATYNGHVTFAPVSQSWNEQTGSGSIIKHAVFTKIGIDIVGASPMLSNNTLFSLNINGGRPLILSSNIKAISIGGASKDGGSPIISHNIIEGNLVARGNPTISYNTINGLLEIKSGTAIIK
jgi:hypothetical protein